MMMAGTKPVSSVEQLRRMRSSRVRSVVFARQGLGLHAMLTSAGLETQRSAEYDWHGLRRGPAEYVLLQYTLSGAGALTFEGREMVVGAGQMMLLHFPHDHRYRFDRQVADHWRFFWICLNGEQVMQTWREVVRRSGPVWTVGAHERLAETAGEICANVIGDRVGSPWQASAMAYGLAMELMDRCALAPGSTPAPGSSPGTHAKRRADAEDRGMRKVAAFVAEHLSERVGVEQMAEAAGYSRYHFTRLFTRWQGVSPGQYLMRQRLRKVVRMLQTTDEPLKRIAEACGFADANYLCKAFAKQYGLSPGALRRSGMYGAMPGRR